MKKKVLFFVYCLVMIAGIILFLIFAPNLIEYKNAKNDNSSEFATKIQLNCDDEIVLSVGSSVELLNNFITITPSNVSNKMSYELTTKNSNGITFENNVITANEIGTYTIKFLIAKSSSTYISDSLKVSVVETENDTNVQMLNNNFTSNTTVNISNIFSFDEIFTSYSINDNNYLDSQGNNVQFLSTGKSVINLNLNADYLTYRYSFNILINPETSTGITIENESNGILEISANVGENFEIIYHLIKDSIESENQSISVTVDNPNSVELVSIFSPIITLKCLSKTTTTLTITPTVLGIEPKQITIVFI